MKILAITAHPDDFETGMGGLAVRLIALKHVVASVILAPGRTRKEIDTRQEESGESHELIGARCYVQTFQIGNLPVTQESREALKKKFLCFAPDAVFVMWGMDIHPDHRAAAILAIEPFLAEGVHTELFAMEVCSRHGVPQSLGFAATHYADITGEPAAMKEKMLACHKSQDFDSTRTAHDELAKNRGAECGVARAEAFVRLTRRGELAPWLRPLLVPSRFILPRMMGIDAT